MLSTANKQGLYNMLYCGAGCFVAWLATTAILGLFKDDLRLNPRILALAILWIGCLVAMLITGITSRLKRGERLLDCGPNPHRWQFLGVGASLLPMHSVFENLLGPWATLFVVTFSAFWLMAASGRLAVFDRGIWVYWALLRWDRIGHYSWSEEDALVITGKGRLPSMRSVVEVPIEHRGEMDRLLEIYAPGTKKSQSENASTVVTESTEFIT